MASVTLGGNPVTVNGNLPKKGETVPDFTLTGKDLKDVALKDFAGKRKVLNIVPSLDTPVCAKSAKVFNEEAGKQAEHRGAGHLGRPAVRRRPLLHRRGPRQRGDAVDRAQPRVSCEVRRRHRRRAAARD